MYELSQVPIDPYHTDALQAMTIAFVFGLLSLFLGFNKALWVKNASKLGQLISSVPKS